MKKEQAKENYLDKIPRIPDTLSWEKDEKEQIIVLIENKGFFNRIAQRFFHRPKVTNVHLDEMGNFIWPLMDGQRSVYDIALLVKEHFGEKANPLYERLISYMNTLKSYGFIEL